MKYKYKLELYDEAIHHGLDYRKIPMAKVSKSELIEFLFKNDALTDEEIEYYRSRGNKNKRKY